MKKYDRTKGTKKDQGIITPKKDKFYKCGCVYRNLPDQKESWVLRLACNIHTDIKNHKEFLEKIRLKSRKSVVDKFLRRKK